MQAAIISAPDALHVWIADVDVPALGSVWLRRSIRQIRNPQ